MPRSISRITKIVAIGEVIWEGVLEVGREDEDSDEMSEWGVRTSSEGYIREFETFEKYFDKMANKRIRLTLTNLEERDESKLIK